MKDTHKGSFTPNIVTGYGMQSFNIQYRLDVSKHNPK